MGELTVLAVRNAQPREKAYRIAAGRGLYLQVMPSGAKYWRHKYRFLDKQMMISHGVFPDVSLAQAREARDEARRLLSSGVDPSSQRSSSRQSARAESATSLRAVFHEWFELRKDDWSDTYAERIRTAVERDVLPFLGDRAIGSIEPRDLLGVLQGVQRRGAKETAHRLRRWLSPVFRYAIVAGSAARDPAADLKGALQSFNSVNMPTITDPARIGELMRAIDGYAGTYVTRGALQLGPMLFTRPGELRFAEWSEIDLERAVWIIPAARMKMRKALKATADPHVVPLSRQAVNILANIRPISGAGRFVFPGEHDSKRAMSENTINAALHRMGFKGEIVAHGFRHMASTALNEAGWSADAIERQLAHKDKDGIRGTYNKAEYMAERRRMMQAWSDYLDALREPQVVAHLRAVA